MNGAATGDGAPEAPADDPATTDDPPPGDRATDEAAGDAAGKAEPPVDGDPSADGQPAPVASGNGQDSDHGAATLGAARAGRRGRGSGDRRPKCTGRVHERPNHR